MKTNTTPTPGPWTAKEQFIYLGPNTAAKAFRLDPGGIEYPCNEQDEANARLIAATPELFTALRGLMVQAGRDAEAYTEDDSAAIWAYIDDASDALEKAQPGSTKHL